MSIELNKLNAPYLINTYCFSNSTTPRYVQVSDIIGFTDSKGNGAIAGFNDGTLGISRTLPGSGGDDVIYLPLTSNVNIPGVWIFQVNEADIQSKTLMSHTRYKHDLHNKHGMYTVKPC